MARRPSLPGRPARRERPDLPVAPGERLLAWATTTDGAVVGGTRDAVYLPARLAWEQVQSADWDQETGTLTVVEVGERGPSGRPVAERREHRFAVEEPGRLLELVRERVTASVVVQRHVPVRGRRGVRVVARRAPGSHGELHWVLEVDEGVDPDDPVVRLAAAQAMAAAREDVGE